jgi:hypothetical protein
VLGNLPLVLGREGQERWQNPKGSPNRTPEEVLENIKLLEPRGGLPRIARGVVVGRGPPNLEEQLGVLDLGLGNGVGNKVVVAVDKVRG